MIGSMVKSINVPDEYDEKPRVVVFICENDAFPAVDMAGINQAGIQPVCQIHSVEVSREHQSWSG